MKTIYLRTLPAFGALMLLASFATAHQPEIRSAFELSPDESLDTPEIGLHAASYTDGDVTEEVPDPQPPQTDVTSSDECDSCNAECTGGECDADCSCDGGSCDNCSCDDFCCDGCLSGPGGDGCCDECLCGPCGDCHGDGCGCGGCVGGCGDSCGDCANGGMNDSLYYAEVQNIFMRAHVSSEVVGKLREKYEWSPRVVLGYESPGGLGGRVRWWSYTRSTTTLDDTDSLRFDLDVIDIEGAVRFSSRRADLLVSGGFRYADWRIVEDGEDQVVSEMPGITFAADGRMPIYCHGGSQWSSVCGARWSMLGGDWVGDNNNVIDPTFDDNFTVHEIYGGFEYLCHQGNHDLYARVVFEVQNWHSDALGETSATDSIGFVGPAIHAGVSF